MTSMANINNEKMLLQVSDLLLTVVAQQVSFHHSSKSLLGAPLYLLVNTTKVLLDVRHFVGEIVTVVAGVDSRTTQSNSLLNKVTWMNQYISKIYTKIYDFCILPF